MTRSEDRSSSGPVTDGDGRTLKLVVVLGCPRSGTTWVQKLLAAHPDVISPPETYLFPHFIAPLLSSWKALESQPIGLDKVLTSREFETSVRALGWRLLERIASRGPGARVLVEKTPTNALVWPAVHRLFPEAWFVHVLRDPRDVVCSLRAAGRSWGRAWAPTGVGVAAGMWCRFVETALGIPERTRRTCLVRYERLLEAGPSELRSLCDLLGLEASERWCHETMSSQSFEALRSDGALPPGFMRRGRAGGWRDELTRRELRVVEHAAGGLMDRLGYERALRRAWLPPPSLLFAKALDRIVSRGRDAVARWRRRALGLPVLPPPAQGPRGVRAGPSASAAGHARADRLRGRAPR